MVSQTDDFQDFVGVTEFLFVEKPMRHENHQTNFDKSSRNFMPVSSAKERGTRTL